MGLDVDIEIAALEIAGGDEGRGHAIAAALRAELARLVAAGGLPVTGSASIDAATIAQNVDVFDGGREPAVIGGRIAQAVYQGLQGGVAAFNSSEKYRP